MVPDADPVAATISKAPCSSLFLRSDDMAVPPRISRRMKRDCVAPRAKVLVFSVLASIPTAMAACISLQGSTTCPAFQSASVSTDSTLVGFLYVLSGCCRFRRLASLWHRINAVY